MKIYLTTERTPCPTEQPANLTLLVMLCDRLREQGIAVEVSKSSSVEQDIVQCNACHPDAAIMIASRLHGTGFEAYHQVTSDWDCYRASHRLAAQMQKQVQRYQLVYKRPVKAGYRIPWLQGIHVPAVMCEYYLNSTIDLQLLLPKLEAQVKAYAKAITEYLE